MSLTAEKIVKQALFYDGVSEDPKGSNNVIFNTDYYGRPVSGAAYAWCVVFVWDMFRIAKGSELFYDGKKVSNTMVVENWGKKAGLIVPKDQAVRGDLVLFDFNHNGQSDHIGFALGSPADGKIQTIEGNTDDQVGIRSRNMTDVCAVIRPKYDKPKNHCDPDTCPIINYMKGLCNNVEH